MKALIPFLLLGGFLTTGCSIVTKNALNESITIKDLTSGTIFDSSDSASAVQASSDFGSTGIGQADPKVFLISNQGAFPISNLAASFKAGVNFSFTGSGFPGTNGNCSKDLAAKASCNVEVEFLPLEASSHSDSLVFSYSVNSANFSISIDLTGQGLTSALLSLSPSSTFSFGTTTVGASLSQSFTVTNTGGVSATALQATTLSAVFNFAGGAYPGTGGDCSDSLDADQSCTLVVNFSPSSATTVGATLSVTYSNGDSSENVSVALSGVGQSPALLTISNGPTYTYSSVSTGVYTPMTFTVTNTGETAALSLSASALDTGFSFTDGTYPGTGGTCSDELDPSDTCLVSITFGSATADTYTSSLVLSYNDGISAQTASLGLAGTVNASVLCTELHRQKLLPEAIYQADSFYGRTYVDPETKANYQAWGIPLARLMAKSPWVTWALRPLISAWAYEMAYRLHVVPESTLFGRTLVEWGPPISNVIGSTLRYWKGHSDSAPKISSRK